MTKVKMNLAEHIVFVCFLKNVIDIMIMLSSWILLATIMLKWKSNIVTALIHGISCRISSAIYFDSADQTQSSKEVRINLLET